MWRWDGEPRGTRRLWWGSCINSDRAGRTCQSPWRRTSSRRSPSPPRPSLSASWWWIWVLWVWAWPRRRGRWRGWCRWRCVGCSSSSDVLAPASWRRITSPPSVWKLYPVVSVLQNCTDVLGWVLLTHDWGESELYKERETQRENREHYWNVFKLSNYLLVLR